MQLKTLLTSPLADIFSGSEKPFSFQQGDVIEMLDYPEGETKKEGWGYGECRRNGEKGVYPSDGIYVIPCMKKPPDEFLVSGLVFIVF